MAGGGARAGAGRKPVKPDDKRVQMVITIDPETKEKLDYLRRDKGIRPGKAVDFLVDEYFKIAGK